MTRLPLALPLLLPLLILAGCSAKPRSENVLLVSLDAARADHIDSGAGGRAWTPELRRFAAGSWVFENAFTPIPQTLPAHLGALSGRLPHELGVYDNEDAYDGRRPLLQQVLQQRGWQTAAIVSLGTLSASSGFARGFAAFADQMHDECRFDTPAERVTDEAIAHLAKFQDKKFFLFVHYSDPHSPYAPPGLPGRLTVFLDDQPLATLNPYVGAILRLSRELSPGAHRLRFRLEADARDFGFFILRRLEARGGSLRQLKNLEYSPDYYGGSHLLKGPAASAVVQCRAAGELRLFQIIPILSAPATAEYYRREVEYLDGQVGRLLRALAKHPAAGRTAVVVFADHGEGLGERDRYTGHVRFLNRQFIHVPLLARFPGERPRRFLAPVSLCAVASWLQDALGIAGSPIPAPAPAWRDLRRGREAPGLVRSFTFAPAALLDRCSLIRWPYQLIVNRDPKTGAETREYYDLRLDCLRKLSAIAPSVLFRREPGLERHFEESRPAWQAAFSRHGLPAGKSDHRQLERLKTLGYIRQP